PVADPIEREAALDDSFETQAGPIEAPRHQDRPLERRQRDCFKRLVRQDEAGVGQALALEERPCRVDQYALDSEHAPRRSITGHPGPRVFLSEGRQFWHVATSPQIESGAGPSDLRPRAPGCVATDAESPSQSQVKMIPIHPSPPPAIRS